MALRLSISSGELAEGGGRSRWTFGVNGGRIGRSQDNDWVLVDRDRFISSHHAEIEHRTGEWWICDTSTNGTFINGAIRPLGRGGRHRLSSGDRIRMGSLELAAEISGGSDFLPDDDDLDLSETALDGSFEVQSLLSNRGSGRTPQPARGPAPPARHSAARRQLPGAAASPPAAPGEAREAATGDAGLTAGFVVFCQGAGIDPLSIPADRREQVLREAGHALREAVMGLMDLSRMRAEFRREAGISGSSRLRDATSPLLQVRAVEEALSQMLAGKSPGAASAPQEVSTEFAKARHHQQAMLVALREALVNMLGNLDPDEMQEQFGGATRGPASTEAQARYWALYREMFKSMAKPGDSGMPPAFQEEFARAYQALASVGLRAVMSAEGSS